MLRSMRTCQMLLNTSSTFSNSDTTLHIISSKPMPMMIPVWV